MALFRAVVAFTAAVVCAKVARSTLRPEHGRGFATIGATRKCSHRRCVTALASGKVISQSDADAFLVPPSRRFGHAPFAVLRAVGLLVTLFGAGFGALAVMLLAFPRITKKDPTARKFFDRVIQCWSAITVWPFFKVKIVGRENLPPEDQTCVYVANHNSFMDILAAYHLNRPFKFVSKASILKIPIVGWAMKWARMITIDRDDKRSQLDTFRKCVDALKKGTSIFIFPEGTRSPTGALIDFKKGPFAMAKKASVPIVPITILGTSRLMPSKKEYFLYRSAVGAQLIIHPAVSAEDIKAKPDDEIVAQVRQSIESGLPTSLQRPTSN